MDHFDKCNVDTFSVLWLQDFVEEGGNYVTPNTKFYWFPPEIPFEDGLCLIENDAHIVAMMSAVREHKTLTVLVDHSNFLQDLRGHAIIPIPSRYRAHNEEQAAEQAVEEQAAVIEEEPAAEQPVEEQAAEQDEEEQAEVVDASEVDDDEDDESDSDFYDSDWNAEDGDADLFLDNIDKDVNDKNEPTEIVEGEDDAGLEHEDLRLAKEQYM